jgi:hypothetical protein
MKTQIIIAAAGIAGVGGFCWTLATFQPQPDPAPARWRNGSYSPAGIGASPAPRGTNDPATDIPIQLAYVGEHPEDPDGWYWLGKSREAAGHGDLALQCWAKALEAHEKAAPAEPDSRYHYRMARFLALCGERERALAAWVAAVDAGFSNAHRASTNPDLDSIRSDERFIEAFKRVEARSPTVVGAG